MGILWALRPFRFLAVQVRVDFAYQQTAMLWAWSAICPPITDQ